MLTLKIPHCLKILFLFDHVHSDNNIIFAFHTPSFGKYFVNDCSCILRRLRIIQIIFVFRLNNNQYIYVHSFFLVVASISCLMIDWKTVLSMALTTTLNEKATLTFCTTEATKKNQTIST